MNHEVIMFVNEDDAVSYQWEKGNHHLTSNNVYLMDIKQVENLKKEGIIFSGNSRPSINSLYIRHPFTKNEYVELDNSADIIQIEKLNNFSMICRLLGAKRVRTKLTSTNITDSELAAKLGVSIPKGSLTAEMKRQIKEENSRRYTLNDDYGEGQDPSLEHTRDFVRKNGLEIDKNIMALINKRDPSYGISNMLKKHTVELNISNEVNSQFELAANVGAVKNLVSISGNYKENLSKREEITLEIEVDF